MLKRVLVLLLVLAVPCLSACGSNRKPINPGTAEVALFAWIVLAPGEQVGGSLNQGCRLTHEHVNDYMENLAATSTIWGQNTQLVYSAAGVAFDQDIESSGNRTMSWDIWDDPTHLLWQNQWWEPDAINIYFVGNVQLGTPPSNRGTLGLTVDPAEPGTFGELPAYIFVNDGGFETTSGFVAGFFPHQMRAYRVLPHELAHYFGRFHGRTFTTTGSQYGNDMEDGSFEHDEAMPQPRNNILRAGGAGPGLPPHPLVVPGAINQTPSEKQEIWNRILAGEWNLP